MAEWSNAPDSKSGVRLYRTVGSNPTCSARVPSTGVHRSPPQQQKALNHQGFLSSEVHGRPLRSWFLRGYLTGYRGKPYGGIFLPSLKDLDMSKIVTQRRTRQLKGHLTDLNLRNLSTGDRPYKVADGNGLYVLVAPTGLRAWRWKYRYAGREKVLPLGSYPEVSLAQARTARDEARKKVLLIRPTEQESRMSVVRFPPGRQIHALQRLIMLPARHHVVTAARLTGRSSRFLTAPTRPAPRQRAPSPATPPARRLEEHA